MTIPGPFAELRLCASQPWPGWFIGPNSEWLWAMLQFVVVAISLFFIYRQIRIQSHANMLTALFALAKKWDSSLMRKARRHVCKEYQENRERRKINQHEERIASFFEEIGFFLDEGAFTPEAIWEEYSYYVEHYWPMLEPKVAEFRKVERDNTWFEHFEKLYKKTQSIAKRRGVYVIVRDDSDLKKFVTGELYTGEQAPGDGGDTNGPARGQGGNSRMR